MEIVILVVLGVSLAVLRLQLADCAGSEVAQVDPVKVIIISTAGAVSFVMDIYLFIKN